MEIINQTKNTKLADRVIIANTAFKRMKGLLGKKNFLSGEALVLEPANSIHTFFMGFPIDLIFVNKKNIVQKTVSSLLPNRLTSVYFSSKFVIELPAGTIQLSSTAAGDTIIIK